MSQATTRFTARRHGFRFANGFPYSLKFDIPLVGKIDLGNLYIGLCGGMCFAALDYYHAATDVPSQIRAPAPRTGLNRYLRARQFDSMMPPAGVIKILEWMVRSDRDVWRMTAGREFRKLWWRLKSGKPAVLALVLVGSTGDPRENHQVVAYAYDLDRSTKQLTVMTYDPNYPRRETRIRMDLSNPSRGISARREPGGAFRGFFVVDYKARRPK